MVQSHQPDWTYPDIQNFAFSILIVYFELVQGSVQMSTSFSRIKYGFIRA